MNPDEHAAAIAKLRSGPKVMELRTTWDYGHDGMCTRLFPGLVDAHMIAGYAESGDLDPPELFEPEPKPATHKPWNERECPHGYLFDCCTQCHEAFHAGRESVAAEPKPSFEKRARALIENTYATNGSFAIQIAKAFAEVAEEARREVLQKAGFRPCKECGKMPCETFMKCAMAQCDKIDRDLRAKMAATPIPSICRAPTEGQRAVDAYERRGMILAATPGSCRVCGLASCMHPRDA
jgi:hypothetical protein